MQTIHKATMLKKVRQNGQWKGYMTPSNVNSFHVNQIEIKRMGNEYHVVREHETMELESYINNFAYYNCNSVLGHRVRFWEE